MHFCVVFVVGDFFFGFIYYVVLAFNILLLHLQAAFQSLKTTRIYVRMKNVLFLTVFQVVSLKVI